MGPIVITGAGGFIGPHVVRALERTGVPIRALTGPPGQAVRPLPFNVQTVSCDILDTVAVRRVVKGANIVVHMAGPASVTQSFIVPKEFCMTHVAGTATVLEACRVHGVKRIIYVSSAEVYGRSYTEKMREDNSIDPRSPYAAAKMGAEYLVKSFVHSYGIKAVILRPFSIYGSGMSRHSVLGSIFSQARSKAKIMLRDLKPIRDYCHVNDLANAIRLACTIEVPSPCILNIGTGRGTSVYALAKLVLKVLGRKIPIQQSGEKRVGRSENYYLVADPSLALDILGWSSEWSLARGLRVMALRSRAK